jgi:hypothetical protein
MKYHNILLLHRFVLATFCPQRYVRDVLSCNELSCDILSGHPEPNRTETEIGLKSCEPNRAHLCYTFHIDRNSSHWNHKQLILDALSMFDHYKLSYHQNFQEAWVVVGWGSAVRTLFKTYVKNSSTGFWKTRNNPGTREIWLKIYNFFYSFIY